MSFPDRVRRVPAVVWAALFSVLLVFPLLGSFGFWDPWELGIAERARAMAKAGALADPTVNGRYGAAPPLDLFFAALGMKVFGAQEFGARLFNGLSAVAALMGIYWAGAGLLRKRAALLAVLALGATPLFVLQSRQLTSDMPLVAALAFTLGGLGRYAWPASGTRRLSDLAIAALGMAVGILAGGALIAVSLPCLSLVGAFVVGWSLRPSTDATSLTEPGVGPHVPADKTFGRAVLSKGWGAFFFIALLGVGVLVFTLTTANIAGKFSLLLGGVPRAGTPPQKFDYLVRQLGFGLFPWSALAVFALGRAFVRLGDEDSRSGGRLAFVQIYLLLFTSFGFALTSVFILMTGDARFASLAPIALALGAFLDEALEGDRPEPVLGLLVATGTMVVARDFFLDPEEVVSVHILTKFKWPPTFKLGPLFLIVGLVVAGGIYLGLATRGRALGKVAPRDLGEAGRARRLLESLIVHSGRFGIQAAIAGAIVFALVLAYAIVPYLSQHVSFKPVFESYRRFAAAGEPIGKYRVDGSGAAFYASGTMAELSTQDAVVSFLRKSERAFVLVAADELANLDAALKVARVDYAVLDASSSRFLLLSNQLRVVAGEVDQNPLKANVFMVSRLPEKQADGTWTWPPDQPPWPAPTRTAKATFGNAIELIGADFPAQVRRPDKVRFQFHFRVVERPPPGFMVFVHIETPESARLIGDHTPLNGAFPLANWLPGEYVRDYVDVDIPYMTTSAGLYTVLIGFWPGGDRKRIPITAGLNDGSDRARLGTMQVH